MSNGRPKTATAPKAVCEPATQSASLPPGFRQATLGELFAKRTEPGRPGLPIMSLTMDMGLVQRDSVDRRVETNLTPEHHLLILKGDLVYNTMRMWQGVSGLAEFDGLLSPAYVVLRSLGEIVPEYAAHLFKDAATIAEFRHFAYGVVDDRLRLYFHDLRRIPVAIPISLSEQRKIAKILTTVDNLLAKTESLIAKYQSVKQGLMHDLFTRGVDEHGHLRPPYAEAPEMYKESKLGWIPREWDVRRLGEALREANGFLQTGPFGSQLHAHEYVDEGVPVIMPQDIVDGQVITDQIARITKAKGQSLSRHRIRFNDVVFSRRGELSRAAAITEREEGWICGTGCFLLRCSPTCLDAQWLASQYRFAHVQRQVDANAVGSTMPSLNNAVMEGLLMMFPKPDEQREITRRRRSVGSSIRSLHAQRDKMLVLKTALMQDLLTGKVRVKVDTEATNV